jgi:hypothetical protein
VRDRVLREGDDIAAPAWLGYLLSIGTRARGLKLLPAKGSPWPAFLRLAHTDRAAHNVIASAAVFALDIQGPMDRSNALATNRVESFFETMKVAGYL